MTNRSLDPTVRGSFRRAGFDLSLQRLVYASDLAKRKTRRPPVAEMLD